MKGYTKKICTTRGQNKGYKKRCPGSPKLMFKGDLPVLCGKIKMKEKNTSRLNGLKK